MCAKGNRRLHKFGSNSREVLDSIPQSGRAKQIKDLDLSFDTMPIEIALGIQWCIESDQFQFRLRVENKSTTRRGILSAVASVYDPLEFLSPFVLGKQLLQKLCKDNVDWDDPLPEHTRLKWESWRDELKVLTSIKIDRCFKPKDLGELKMQELHHFSDASTNGYGQCSYLRLDNTSGKVHCSLVIGCISLVRSTL